MVFVKSCVVLVLVAVVCANPSEDKKSYQLSDDVEVVSNGFQPENPARGEQNLEDTVEGYIQSHDVTVKLPLDTAVTMSARDLNNGIMNFKLKFSSSDVDEGRGKKKKLKKILIPIAVLLLLKALTLIPLMLGVLALKAFNAIQLGFFTFMVSLGMAIFELCKKFAAEHPPAIVAHAHAHEHWDAHHRSLDVGELPVADAQQMAYSAHY